MERASIGRILYVQCKTISVRIIINSRFIRINFHYCFIFSLSQNFLTESLKQLDKMYPQNSNLSVTSSQQQAQQLADIKPKDLGLGDVKK